ncbi:MAG: type II toxin-antitoxin system VapC family toxin [Thermomicrobiales bacterium]
MSYLIDTDVVINYLYGQPDAVGLLANLRRHGLGVSVLTYMEVVEGLGDGHRTRVVRRGFKQFMRRTRVYVVSRHIAERTAMIRRDLRRRNMPIDHRALDLIIAATAIEHGIPLVTRNTRDYADIPGLDLYAPA